MNELQFGSKIRQHLNLGARLDSHTAERLRAARERALSSQKLEREPALAWAGHVAGSFGGLRGISIRLLLPLIVLSVGLITIYTWQQKQRAAEVEEIDAQLLTDDLPIDAYLDKGFEAWLKRRGGS